MECGQCKSRVPLVYVGGKCPNCKARLSRGASSSNNQTPPKNSKQSSDQAKKTKKPTITFEVDVRPEKISAVIENKSDQKKLNEPTKKEGKKNNTAHDQNKNQNNSNKKKASNDRAEEKSKPAKKKRSMDSSDQMVIIEEESVEIVPKPVVDLDVSAISGLLNSRPQSLSALSPKVSKPVTQVNKSRQTLALTPLSSQKPDTKKENNKKEENKKESNKKENNKKESKKEAKKIKNNTNNNSNDTTANNNTSTNTGPSWSEILQGFGVQTFAPPTNTNGKKNENENTNTITKANINSSGTSPKREFGKQRTRSQHVKNSPDLINRLSSVLLNARNITSTERKFILDSVTNFQKQESKPIVHSSSKNNNNNSSSDLNEEVVIIAPVQTNQGNGLIGKSLPLKRLKKLNEPDNKKSKPLEPVKEHKTKRIEVEKEDAMVITVSDSEEEEDELSGSEAETGKVDLEHSDEEEDEEDEQSSEGQQFINDEAEEVSDPMEESEEILSDDDLSCDGLHPDDLNTYF